MSIVPHMLWSVQVLLGDVCDDASFTYDVSIIELQYICCIYFLIEELHVQKLLI